jgi:hypothetical protein
MLSASGGTGFGATVDEALAVGGVLSFAGVTGAGEDDEAFREVPVTSVPADDALVSPDDAEPSEVCDPGVTCGVTKLTVFTLFLCRGTTMA